MSIIKRNGEVVEFDRATITASIEKANNSVTNHREKLTKEDIRFIVARIYERVRKRTCNTSIAEIEDMVSIELMKERAYEAANIYVKNCVKDKEKDQK